MTKPTYAAIIDWARDHYKPGEIALADGPETAAALWLAGDAAKDAAEHRIEGAEDVLDLVPIHWPCFRSTLEPDAERIIEDVLEWNEEEVLEDTEVCLSTEQAKTLSAEIGGLIQRRLEEWGKALDHFMADGPPTHRLPIILGDGRWHAMVEKPMTHAEYLGWREARKCLQGDPT